MDRRNSELLLGRRGLHRRGLLLGQLKTTERTLSRSEAPPVWGRRVKESPSQLASVKTVAQVSVRFFGEWPGWGLSSPTPGRSMHRPLGGLLRKPVASYPSSVT
ncbi:conserved hypothetical protein [Streptomyces filamentosus NRRL 15998]|uniref:Uncharacterized protein n=1 Tax=Streptomyces filamentosus NRRL 15998 TaxID=457431 RepID=D6ADQ6_STRFL|nr:conserved hypothetical protein [Streptomyces filamentosus NRRL 15998]